MRLHWGFTVFCFWRPPRKLLHFLAGVFGAACGAHATVQAGAKTSIATCCTLAKSDWSLFEAIYFYWNSDGSEAPLVLCLGEDCLTVMLAWDFSSRRQHDDC